MGGVGARSRSYRKKWELGVGARIIGARSEGSGS